METDFEVMTRMTTVVTLREVTRKIMALKVVIYEF